MFLQCITVEKLEKIHAIIYWERNVKQNGCDLSNHEGFHLQWEKCVPETLPMR